MNLVALKRGDQRAFEMRLGVFGGRRLVAKKMLVVGAGPFVASAEMNEGAGLVSGIGRFGEVAGEQPRGHGGGFREFFQIAAGLCGIGWRLGGGVELGMCGAEVSVKCE